MGAWDYLKYLAGAKPPPRKPLDFTPMPEADFARISDPTQDPKLPNPRYQYDPNYLHSGLPDRSWTGMIEDPDTAGAPAEWHADAAKMAITPEEVEFLTRSQEKRDAATREAAMTPPKLSASQAAFKPFRNLGVRIGPGITGAIGGAMAGSTLGPLGAVAGLVAGGYAGGFAGSEAAQGAEVLDRRRAEADLPQVYGTPAYQALLAQIEGGRQERDVTASHLEGLIQALPLGASAATRFVPRVTAEAGRGAALSTAATALLHPLDTSAPIEPGGARGDAASLRDLASAGTTGALFGGTLGAFSHLVNRGNSAPPEAPSLSEQWADLRGTNVPVPPRRYSFTEDLARHDRGGVSDRPPEPDTKPPFWEPLSWEPGQEPPVAAKDFMGAKEAGTIPVDARVPLSGVVDRAMARQAADAANAPPIEPPAPSAAPAAPAPGTKPPKGPRLSGVEKATTVTNYTDAIQAAIARRDGAGAEKLVAELDALQRSWKAAVANAPEGGTVAPGGRLFKPSPDVEGETELANLFAEGATTPPVEQPAGTPKPLQPSGITEADVDQLIGKPTGTQTPAAPSQVPYEQRIGTSGHPVAPTPDDLRINLAGAASRYAKAVREGDIYTARLEQQNYWAIYDRLNNPEAFVPQPSAPVPPAGPAVPEGTIQPPNTPGSVPTGRPPAVVAPPAPLGGEPVMPKVGLTHDAPKTLGGGAEQPDLAMLSPEAQLEPPPFQPDDTPELQRLLKGENRNLQNENVFGRPTDAELEARAGVQERRRMEQDPGYADLLALLNEQNARMRDAGVFEPPARAPRPDTFVREAPTEPYPGHVQYPLPAEGGARTPGPIPEAPAPAAPAGEAPGAVRTASGGGIPAPRAPEVAPAPAAAPVQPSWKPKPTAPVPREGAVIPLTPMGGEAERIAILDPRVLGLDPAEYQFKKSDASGSTGKLEGARAWATKTDPVTGRKTPNTPPLLVHRRLDGTLWIADGHQRYGLYKRLWAEGKELLPLEAEVLDEANGWTIEKVRRLASLRNIGEGTATSLDIAKLIRSGGALTGDESAMISKTSQVGLDYRKGEELAKLGDDAFQVVVNEEIPIDHAVYIPKYLSNPESQLLAAKLVGQAKLKTMEEAEAMVLTLRDKMLKAHEDGAQIGMDDLFGTNSNTKLRSSIAIQTSLVKAVQSELRTSKGLFTSLLKNKERAESVGTNALDYEANKAVSEETKQLLFYWAKYRDAYGSNTNRALSNLSMEIANGSIKKADATQRVLDALRQDITTRGTATGNAAAGPSAVAAAGRPDGAGGVPTVHEPTGVVQPEPAAAPVAAKAPPVEAKPPEPVPDATQGDIFGEPPPKASVRHPLSGEGAFADLQALVDQNAAERAAEGGPVRPSEPKPIESGKVPAPVQSAATPAIDSSTSLPVPPPVAPKQPQSVNEMFPRTYEQATRDEYVAMRVARNGAMDAATQRGMRDRVLNEVKAAKDKFTEGGPDAVIEHWKQLQAEIEQAPVTSTFGPMNWIPGTDGEYISAPEHGSVTVRFNVPKPSEEARAFLKVVPPGGKKPMFRYDRDTGNWYGDILGHENNRDPKTGVPKGYPQADLEAAARQALQIEGATKPPVAETKPPVAETKPPVGEPPLSPPVNVKTAIGVEPTLPGMAEGVGVKPATAKPVAEVPFALTQERGTGEPVAPQDVSLPMDVPKTQTVKPQNVEEIVGAIPTRKKPAPPEPPLAPEARELLQLRRDVEAGQEIKSENYPNLTTTQQAKISRAVARTEAGRKWALNYMKTHEVTVTDRDIQQAIAMRDQAEHYFEQLTERVPNKPDVPATLTPQEKAAGVTPGVPQRAGAREIFRAAEGVPSRTEATEARAERAWDRGDFERWTELQKQLSDITYGVGIRNQQPGQKGTNIEAFGFQTLYEKSGLQDIFEKHPQAFWSLWSAIGGGTIGATADEEDRMRGFIRGAMTGLAASSLASPNVRAEAMRMGRAIAQLNAKSSELTGKVALRATPDPLKDMSLFQMWRPGLFEKNAPEAFARYLKVMDEYNYTAHYGGLAEMPQPVQQFAAKKAIRRVVEELRTYAKEIESKQPIRAAYVREGADALAKKPTNLQRAVKEVMSPLKEVDNQFIERNVGGNIYRVLTGYAVSTALQNLTQPILALRHVQLKDLAWAYSVAGSDWAKSITKHIDIHRPMDLAEEAGIVVGKTKPEPTGWKKWAHPQQMLMESDKLNRRVVYLAAMKQAERRGLMGSYQAEWSQAVANKTFSEAFRSEADQWSRAVMRGTQGEVGPLGFNPLWRGPIMGSAKPFMKFPTLLLGNLIDTFTQPDKTGRNRFVLSMMSLIAAGMTAGLDFEDVLLMGSRPMGIDITDPEKTVKNWVTGGQFPAVRVAKDVAAHVGGTANHKLIPNITHPDEYLQSDLSYLLAGRYPTQLAQAMQRTYVSDIRPAMRGEEPTLHMKRTASGAPNPITKGEELANLLGVKTTRQTERAGVFEEASKLTFEANQKERDYSTEMRRRIATAIDMGNAERLASLAGEYNAHKRNSKAAGAVISAAMQSRIRRIASASSKPIRAELMRQFGDQLAATEPIK